MRDINRNVRNTKWLYLIIVLLLIIIALFVIVLILLINNMQQPNKLVSIDSSVSNPTQTETQVPQPTHPDSNKPTAESIQEREPEQVKNVEKSNDNGKQTEREGNETSLDENSARLVQTLNLATVSIKKIINTENRIVLDQEYDNIINNLVFERVKAEKKVIDLYTKIMGVITQFKLNNEEKERFSNAFERSKKKAVWKAIGGVRAYGANPLSFVLSLAQSSISAFFNYKDVKSQMEEELDKELWEIKKDQIEQINELWQEWLSACWDTSSKYNFESKNLYVLRGGVLDNFISAEQEIDIDKAMRSFEDLERNSIFLSSYPPFWLSYAIVAEKAGNKAKRDQCLDNFFKYYREILNRDPYFGRACVMRLRTIIEKPSALQDKNRIKEIEELLIKADRHLDKTDGQSRIFISAIYQKLGKPDEARRILQLNIDRNVDKDISELALDNLNKGRDVASDIPQVLALFIQEEGTEDSKDILPLEELQRLAEQGEPNAMEKLGRKHFFGFGVPLDYVKARQWCEKSAEKGNAYAMSGLGQIYFLGLGVPQDYEKARQWYEKSAEKGDAWAMYILGGMYVDGQGVPQDYEKARQWYEKSAEKDNDDAMFNLGVMYVDGQGVPQDYDKARQWFEKSAEKGNAWAMYSLGGMYEDGQGVPQDYEKARQWYEKSAEKGNAMAMFNLGLMYYEGLGVPQDYDKARQWFEKAVEEGNAGAMMHLGDMYGNGEGVPKDRVLAYAWYTLAMKYGGESSGIYKDAKNERDGLSGRLWGISNNEIQEAEELVKSYTRGTILRRKK